MHAANDNEVEITEGSGNIFADLGLDDAERAMEALREFYAKGGRRYEDFKAELEAAAIRKGEA
jgi:uncharacterized membrane protein